MTMGINIGLIGFQMVVRDGLTVFNLVDGVVDEFRDESGVDTTESSNQQFDFKIFIIIS